MTDIIDFDSDDNSVTIGEEKVSERISYQLAQDFYNEITGKTEKIKESYNEPVVLCFENIEQLHHRLTQSLEQYNICSIVETYSVSYVDDSSERFSSLERLRLHLGARGRAVEEVIVQFQVLLILPKTQRPQEYTISAKFLSRVAKIENMRREMGPMAANVPLFQFERAKTAIFSIDYIDITVATALMSVLKEWFNTIERETVSKLIKESRSFSHFAPPITKYIFIATIAYILYRYYTSIELVDFTVKFSSFFILISILVTYLAMRVGVRLGKNIERNLDSIYERSYIKFSGADENFVKDSSLNLRKSKFAALFNTAIALGIGIVSSLVASVIIAS